MDSSYAFQVPVSNDWHLVWDIGVDDIHSTKYVYV